MSPATAEFLTPSSAEPLQTSHAYKKLYSRLSPDDATLLAHLAVTPDADISPSSYTVVPPSSTDVAASSTTAAAAGIATVPDHPTAYRHLQPHGLTGLLPVPAVQAAVAAWLNTRRGISLNVQSRSNASSRTDIDDNLQVQSQQQHQSRNNISNRGSANDGGDERDQLYDELRTGHAFCYALSIPPKSSHVLSGLSDVPEGIDEDEDNAQTALSDASYDRDADDSKSNNTRGGGDGENSFTWLYARVKVFNSVAKRLGIKPRDCPTVNDVLYLHNVPRALFAIAFVAARVDPVVWHALRPPRLPPAGWTSAAIGERWAKDTVIRNIHAAMRLARLDAAGDDEGHLTTEFRLNASHNEGQHRRDRGQPQQREDVERLAEEKSILQIPISITASSSRPTIVPSTGVDIVVAGAQGVGKSAVLQTLLQRCVLLPSHPFPIPPAAENACLRAKHAALVAALRSALPIRLNEPVGNVTVGRFNLVPALSTDNEDAEPPHGQGRQKNIRHVNVNDDVFYPAPLGLVELPAMEASEDAPTFSQSNLMLEAGTVGTIVEDLRDVRAALILHVARLDALDEKQLTRMTRRLAKMFTSESLLRSILVLTHGQSVPPLDLSYDVWVFDMRRRARDALARAVGRTVAESIPIVIVENSAHCNTDPDDHTIPILPDGSRFLTALERACIQVLERDDVPRVFLPTSLREWWETWAMVAGILVLALRIW